MGQEGDKFLAPYPARPGVRDRSSRAVLRPQPAARLVARDVPRARGWLELHDGREDSRKLERRLLLPLAEAETHHVPVTPARERARPQHPERVVPHLVVGHDAAAVARGHGRVQPVEVVVLFARRGEEDALLAPAREQPRLLGSGRPARRVLLVQHEQHSRRTPLPPDALDRAQQPVHLLQVEELLAIASALRLVDVSRTSGGALERDGTSTSAPAPPLRLADGGRGRVGGACRVGPCCRSARLPPHAAHLLALAEEADVCRVEHKVPRAPLSHPLPHPLREAPKVAPAAREPLDALAQRRPLVSVDRDPPQEEPGRGAAAKPSTSVRAARHPHGRLGARAPPSDAVGGATPAPPPPGLASG
eukprot:CAMPEP_0185389708 /NCGR_PEP_ID=MMETSP1364-20130426/70823_1 /TAXON_ID=38817 /ORGANISM="Gephyrocapsa oceanica, Strain RCC1303" /LENGTH=361 /DNA_ID=CAMNT_0027991671 /DNA_START=81 /DNA_END=1165 /DNA_ORIENTATION=+